MLNAKLEPKPKANCMPYGYYQNTYGIPYKYYEAHGLFEGLFNGNKVEAKLSTMQTIFSKFSEQRILRKLFHVVSYVYKTKALNRFLN